MMLRLLKKQVFHKAPLFNPQKGRDSLRRSGSKSSVRSAQDLKEDDEKPKERMDLESLKARYMNPS